jgi:hypothetical protein
MGLFLPAHVKKVAQQRLNAGTGPREMPLIAWNSYQPLANSMVFNKSYMQPLAV